MAPRPDIPVEPPTPDWTDPVAGPDPVGPVAGANLVGPVAGPDLVALLASYAVPAGHFDELLDGGRAPRPHWRSFAQHAGDLSADQLARTEARVARQLYENGVTYNVYTAAEGPTRPWALDVLPLVLPAAEWAPLADGLRQRARVLNAMAADLYGEQRLLSGGLVPPALVLANPGFLRPCHGVVPPGGVFLHQVAFDLARGPDGRWWVVGTRTQAPSGAGYALENRLTVSRLFPDAFRGLRVHRLAHFFRALQETLLEHAPRGSEAPHVVLLSPGPYSETYFEHAYLARYLGFTLVEGGDLTVRGDRVYLKTLRGLERVHAVLRRLDDDFCDPLELRADSTLGVPGLVQAWRAGHVLVANAFGTGVLESPALYGSIPTVCERRLGETLMLPSVATWWCDPQRSFSLAFSVEQTLRVAGSIRARVSVDTWRIVNQVAHALARPPRPAGGLAETLELIDVTIARLAAVGGLETDLDPTNDLLPDVRHVTLGWGRDYGDVSPLRGVILGGAQHTLHVGVSVMPLDGPEWDEALGLVRTG